MNPDKYSAIVVHSTPKNAYRIRPLKAELSRVGIDRFEIVSSPDPLTKAVHDTLQRFVREGWENALFLEDDIRFLRDADEVRRIFEGAPEREYDICSFDNFIHLPQEVVRRLRADGRWYEYMHGLCGTSCWSLNRRAAEILLRSYESHPKEPTDSLLFMKHQDIRSAFYTRCACIQLCYRDCNNVRNGWCREHHMGYFALDYADYNVPRGYVFGSMV